MTNEINELPVFPTSAPAIFSDQDASTALFTDVLQRLAAVIDVESDELDAPTPCSAFTVGELQTHALGWLRFFAAALRDPTAAATRPDPEAFALADGELASNLVADALADIRNAIARGAAGEIVTMSSSRMAGDGVLAMALGEYIVHAWDLATATGEPYSASDDAAQPSLQFLQGMVAPEYRGPDSGFFDEEVSVPADASPLHKLLGFAGRDPHWSPSKSDA